MSVPFLYEGDQEISQLVSRFQNEEETVLCAVHLWEGLDIPRFIIITCYHLVITIPSKRSGV